MIFRIDDVSANTDIENLQDLIYAIYKNVEVATILLAISPLVADMSDEPERDRERIFPRPWSAMSDHRIFFQVDKAFVPRLPRLSAKVLYASHGLVHVDHRLMGREAQELSIVTSCSLIGTQTFVPPFNKYNADTVSICDEHSIELVRFEDGWKHVNHNKFDENHLKYYLHTHDITVGRLKEWFA